MMEFYGDQVRAAIKGAAARATEAAGEHLLQVSLGEVPRETGELAASGFVSTDRATAETAVGYTSPYALRQHEETSYRHDDGQKAKYLEDPMLNERSEMAQIIAVELRRGMS